MRTLVAYFNNAADAAEAYQGLRALCPDSAVSLYPIPAVDNRHGTLLDKIRSVVVEVAGLSPRSNAAPMRNERNMLIVNRVPESVLWEALASLRVLEARVEVTPAQPPAKMSLHAL